MNGPCDADNKYVMFATGSTNSTRNWYRSENSGRLSCDPNSQEKLNYYVLKHPPSATPEPSTRSPMSTATTVFSLRTENAVKIKGRLYVIDPLIYEAVAASLLENPIEDPCDLKPRIDRIRAETGIPAPLSVQLANVGLSNYTKRYTYNTAGSKRDVKIKKGTTVNRVFDFALKTGIFGKDLIVYSVFYEKYVPVIETKQWLDLQDDLAPYSRLFPLKTFSYKKSQFVQIADNTGCKYTDDLREILPGGSASLFGVNVLTNEAVFNYFQSINGGQTFFPIPCTLTPKYRAPAVGMLFNFVRDGAVKLIFVPAESDLDRIQNVPWGVGDGLEFSPI